MIKSFIINNYLTTEFFKIVVNISLIFFCSGFTFNIIEEINFFKDYQNVGINIQT